MRLFLPFFILLAVSFTLVFCTGEPTPEEAPVGMFEPMPEKSDTIEVAFRETNFWIQGDSLFCVTGIVDNKRSKWQKIWLRIDMKDESGKAVQVKGKSELILRAFSEAIPPYGASSFFYSVPVARLSGRPADCSFTGVAGLNVQEGPILVVGQQSNVKMFTGSDTTSSLEDREEAAWLITCDLENPLATPSYHPRLNVLVYGRDRKLWFSQVLNPEDTITKAVFMQTPLPIQGGGRGTAFFQVGYGGLPAKLQETRIGLIDVLLFDARVGENAVDAENTTPTSGGQ